MTELPLWAAYAFASATFSAVLMLVQEKMQLEGFAIAFWNKVAAATLMLPIVFYLGWPDDPVFYGLVAAQAVLWVISDVIFFNAIPKVGAGVVSRILPGSIIISFFLWFLIEPSLIDKYLETPYLSAALVAVLFASVYFSMRLRRCAISWQAVRLIWFVIFAAVVGPLAWKLITQHVPVQKGAFSYVCVEAMIMICFWLIWYAVKPPIEKHVLFNWRAVKGGYIVGGVSSLMIASNFAAIHYVDNPALVPAVKFLDTVLILVYYKMIGRKDGSDVASGLGIVFCAAMIVFLKSA